MAGDLGDSLSQTNFIIYDERINDYEDLDVPKRLIVLSLVLFESLKGYLTGQSLRSRDGSARYGISKLWIENRNQETDFSFESLSFSLGIKADYLRLGIRNAESAGYHVVQ